MCVLPVLQTAAVALHVDAAILAGMLAAAVQPVGCSPERVQACLGMPRPKKLQSDAELADLNIRSTELSRARDKAIVKHVMDTWSESIELMMRTLRHHGYDVSGKTVRTDADADTSQGPKSRRALAVEKRVQRAREQSHAAAAAEMSKSENADWVPTKYWNLDALSVVLLITAVLSKVEGRALSAANLRSMKGPKGQSPVTKVNLCKIVEYVTGICSDVELVGPLRYWPYLIAVLQARAKMRGSRGMSMPLPPDWDTFGVYSVKFVDGKVYVSNDTTGKSTALPASCVPPFGAAEDLYIVSNWSETRATLKSKAAPEHAGVILHQYLPDLVCDHAVAMPAPCRTALSRASASRVPMIMDRIAGAQGAAKLALGDQTSDSLALVTKETETRKRAADTSSSPRRQKPAPKKPRTLGRKQSKASADENEQDDEAKAEADKVVDDTAAEPPPPEGVPTSSTKP
jgi:hypothetical protein